MRNKNFVNNSDLMSAIVILLLVYLSCRYIKPIWVSFSVGLIVFVACKFFILNSRGYSVNILNVIAEFLGYFVMAFGLYFISKKLKESNVTKKKNEGGAPKEPLTYNENIRSSTLKTFEQNDLVQQYVIGGTIQLSKTNPQERSGIKLANWEKRLLGFLIDLFFIALIFNISFQLITGYYVIEILNGDSVYFRYNLYNPEGVKLMRLFASTGIFLTGFLYYLIFEIVVSRTIGKLIAGTIVLVLS